MTQKLQNLIQILATSSLTWQELISKAENTELNDIINIRDIYSWQAIGIDIKKNKIGRYELKIKSKLLTRQEFCVVDIETTGSIRSGQIIEIGAVKLKNGKILSSFESLVYAPEVPQNITDLTGIHSLDLKNAPNIATVMEKFKLFIGTSVFVAHNVKFDFEFISYTLQKLGYCELFNSYLDTIDLARRTIPAPKYGLAQLKELLDINSEHHRALSDAKSAAIIFNHCINKLPYNIKTTQELMDFSKTAPMLKYNFN